MADVFNIPPNFGVKEFVTDAETETFLEKFGFKLINQRSDYEVWETTKEPRRRAIKYEGKGGLFIVAQLIVDDRS